GFDIPFVLEHLGDARADLAARDHHHLPPDARGVADAGQHVGDGILVIHRDYILRLFLFGDGSWIMGDFRVLRGATYHPSRLAHNRPTSLPSSVPGSSRPATTHAGRCGRS